MSEAYKIPSFADISKNVTIQISKGNTELQLILKILSRCVNLAHTWCVQNYRTVDRRSFLLNNRTMQSKRGFVLLIPLFVVALIAAGAAFGYYYFVVNKPAKVETRTATTTEVSPKQFFLSVINPVDGVLVTEKKLLVTGTSLPDTVVVIYTDDSEVSTQSDKDGRFSGQIDLIEGLNSLTVTAFGEADEETSVSMDVVYNKDS